MTHHATGTGDVSYDLVSVLYHTLQESSTIEQYIDDAQERGDAEVAAFLADIQKQDRERAQRAKALLAVRFNGTSGGSAARASTGSDEDEHMGQWRPHATSEPAEG